MFESISVRLKATRIAEAWAAPRCQALSALADILDSLGLTTQQLRDSPEVDRLLRAVQLVEQVHLCRDCGSYLKKTSLLDFGTLQAAIIAPHDLPELSDLSVQIGKHSLDSLAQREFVSMRLLRIGNLPINSQTLRISAASVDLLALNSLQVVALAFGDKQTVDLLQLKKVSLHESFA